MPKLAIIDQTVSAGGVERFLHGLIGGAIEERVTDDWEIVLVRNRLNSANTHVPWPQHLQSPNLQIQYIEGENPLARVLNRFARAGLISGIRGTGWLQHTFARLVRRIGPDRWRAYCGELNCWIADYLQKNHFDVVYFSYPYFLYPPRTKTPIVATPHDFIYKYGLSTTPAVQRQLDKQMPMWLEACSQVVVSSEFVANDLKRFYPSWAHKARIIRLGIPAAEREPTTNEVEAFRKRNGLPEQFVLVVGWVVEHKNHLVVFEAIAKLRDRGLRIPVVCVGPNSIDLSKRDAESDRTLGSKDYVGRVLEFCRSAGLKNGTDYFSLGFVPDFDVDCLYRSAMMLVVPTITDAGSFPAIEAMRAGCPVAYSRIPVYQETMSLIQDNAWTFPTHDSSALADLIAEVAEDGEEARRRAKAAKEIVPQVFCWKKTARAYFSVFEEVAGLRKRTASDSQLSDVGATARECSVSKERQ
jgi:glycosyltransferase involved in cell wall biosynthesis